MGWIAASGTVNTAYATFHDLGQHTGIFIDDDPDPVCQVVEIKLGRNLRLRLQGATL
jgi:hypothetical protein